jgi:hypothetical protein
MKTRSTLHFFFLFFLLLSLANILQAQRGRSYNSYPVRGQYFSRVPGISLNLQFGGNPYYYSGGSYYRPYGNYFEIAVPPLGLRVNLLPRGYWPLQISGYHYYYSNGIFYRKNKCDYEVVQAPVGAEIPSIPRDSKVMVIDGEKYYEYNGTYFKDYVKVNGELWYTVEGKHGILNTDRNNVTDNTPQPVQLSQPVQPSADTRPSIGEVFDKLPADCKTVVINSKKYFISADNVYYEEVIDGKQVRYKVTGK